MTLRMPIAALAIVTGLVVFAACGGSSTPVDEQLAGIVRTPYPDVQLVSLPDVDGVEREHPGEVDAVAFPYAPIALSSPARWHYAMRHWYAPDRALDAIFNGNRRFRRNLAKTRKLVADLGLDKARIVPVEHHLTHASSCYHLSGFKEKTAILGIDGKGEYATTFFGYGENGRIHKIKEFYDPDSLGGMYGAMTEYLGFEMLDEISHLLGGDRLLRPAQGNEAIVKPFQIFRRDLCAGMANVNHDEVL